MAGETLVQTWQQAFEDYTVANIRNIENQLRTSATQNRNKLRTLVGSNYRALLTTADQTIQLDAQIHVAETQLSELGRRCRPLELEDTDGASIPPRASYLAQLSLLHRCLSVITPQLQHTGILLCAKLLVLSRLLYRSISTANAEIKSLRTLQERISSLRRRTLVKVDRRLSKGDIKQADLVETVCAFCLVTNSSSNDALDHFQHLRLQVLRRIEFKNDENVAPSWALRYFIKSIGLSRTFLGYRVPDALRLLQAKPLLQDRDLHDSAKLELNDVVPLIAPEIQGYVPFVKRAELSVDDVRAWSKTALVVVTEGLKHSLSKAADVSAVFDLRTGWFSVWLPVYFTSNVHSSALGTVQEIFNDRIVALIEQQVNSLDDIGKAILRSSDASPSVEKLWSSEVVLRQPKNDARAFTRDLQSRFLGLSGAQHSAMQQLDTWVEYVKRLQTLIEISHNVRWQDKLEEPEEEQQDTADSMIRDLSTHDPQVYSQAFERYLKVARISYEERLEQAVARVDQDKEAYHYSLLLRILRESERRLAPAFANSGMARTDTIARELLRKLAAETTARLAEQMESQSPPNDDPKTVVALPAKMPSPRAIRSLKRLCTNMEDLGATDVWSPTAVKVVKETVRSRIFQQDYKDFYMQNAFDADYLRAALQPRGDSEAGLVNGATHPDPEALEYWKRTQLFFGLLT